MAAAQPKRCYVWLQKPRENDDVYAAKIGVSDDPETLRKETNDKGAIEFDTMHIYEHGKNLEQTLLNATKEWPLNGGYLFVPKQDLSKLRDTVVSAANNYYNHLLTPHLTPNSWRMARRHK
jgi:hypothetical protein